MAFKQLDVFGRPRRDNEETAVSTGTPTLGELNEIHRAFWDKQHELMERRLADPALGQAWWTELQRYQIRCVSIRDQESTEALLEKFDRVAQTVLIEQARRAGRAPKADALQDYIVALVRERPRITARQLLARLEQDQWGELIEEIEDGAVHFTQPDGSEHGRSKKAPISGLKDRLSRAKKQVNSR